MNSRLCGCSFIRQGFSASQGLALARRLGFINIDIGIGGGNAHFDPQAVGANPDPFAEIVLHEVDRLGVQLNECFLLNFGWPINSPDPGLRQKSNELFPGVCHFARSVGCRSVLVIPGPLHVDFGIEQSVEWSIGVLQEMVATALDYGLFLNFEPDVESFAKTPEVADELCQRIPGLGLTLDYSHFVCQGIDPSRIALLHRHVRHVHIRQAVPSRIATDFDKGIINYPGIFHQLESIGYSGLYCIEYLALARTEEAGLEAEGRTVVARLQCEHYLEGSFDENRNAITAIA